MSACVYWIRSAVSDVGLSHAAVRTQQQYIRVYNERTYNGMWSVPIVTQGKPPLLAERYATSSSAQVNEVSFSGASVSPVSSTPV